MQYTLIDVSEKSQRGFQHLGHRIKEEYVHDERRPDAFGYFLFQELPSLKAKAGLPHSNIITG
jgi:hypothetical protein